MADGKFLTGEQIEQFSRRMWLLRTIAPCCDNCNQSAFVIMRTTSEAKAREMVVRSNSHGTFLRGIDWNDPTKVSCRELPYVDGPEGIVVGSWFEETQRSN